MAFTNSSWSHSDHQKKTLLISQSKHFLHYLDGVGVSDQSQESLPATVEVIDLDAEILKGAIRVPFLS